MVLSLGFIAMDVLQLLLQFAVPSGFFEFVFSFVANPVKARDPFNAEDVPVHVAGVTVGAAIVLGGIK